MYEDAIKVWNKPAKLNENDYHSSTGYLSNSFIGDFISCEFSAIINYALKTDSEFNSTYAAGHLVEAYVFEGEKGFQEMCQKFKDHAYSKTKGKEHQLLKWVTDCKVWAKSILKHDWLKKLLRSDSSIYHQVITFELHGMKWRGEIDFLNLNKETEIDLKTTAEDFYEKKWNPETKAYDLTFIDKWDYHRQRALYQEGIRQNFEKIVTPRILAVSKKNKSVRMFKFDDQERLDNKLKSLKPVVDRFKEVIDGAKPKKCNVCPICVDHEDVSKEILISKYCAEES